MLILPGANALSASKVLRLISALRDISPNVSSLAARYVHFVKGRGEFGKSERTALERLLDDGSQADVPAMEQGETFIVVPRPGTISPWSSKATDIARIAGLERVERIERGIRYVVGMTDAPRSASRAELSAPLFDRMTQVVLDTEQAAEALFRVEEPRPTRRVDVQSGGREALVQANTEWA